MAMIGGLQLWSLVIMTVVCMSHGVHGYGSSPGVCNLPKVTGPCLGNFPRYYFNSRTGRCEMFIYGGCGGNANNFLTFEQCWDTCGDPGVCSLPSDTGPCRAYFEMYYFNVKSGLCEKFVYGGCKGNANRFSTLDQCRTACGGCELCKLPKDEGSCWADIMMYYFNYKAQECQVFFYGGCDGNANRFDTLEECQFQCTDRRI